MNLTDDLITQLIFWSVIFALCIIVEIITLGLTTIWFAGGALIAGITALFSVTFTIQVLIFIVISLVLFFTTRPIARKHFNSDNMEKTNVESLIGREVIVTSAIDNLHSAGQVKVNGLEWTARSADNEIIPEGSLVKINEVQGVKLIVT